MAVKVTMQDIADALGLSRNTVSKAINNTGVIAENTKDLILKKAAEMGYRNLSVQNIASSQSQSSSGSTLASSGSNEIAMLTSAMPGGSHFAVTTLDRMQQIFSSRGYSMAFYRVTPAELQQCTLPGSLSLKKAAAIFCMELFDYDYCRMLIDLGIPLLTIDTPLCMDKEPLPVDTLMMENTLGIHSFVRKMAQEGRKTIGFIGNMSHCRSFFERGSACMTAAALNGFLPAEPYSILDFPPGESSTTVTSYPVEAEKLYEMLQNMPALPEVFVCANDFIAINTIGCLRRMQIRCPEDILVMGFDDSPEARYHTPALSTVHIHTQIMGDLAAELLLSRIANPEREPRLTYAITDLILRESTNRS